MIRVLPFIFLFVLSTSCLRPPVVRYSQSFRPNEDFIETADLGRTYLKTLLQRARGLQGGDPIFLRSSAVYWILPEVDKIDLELTSVEEGFESIEYQTRLERLDQIHDEYLVFLALLKVPFYPRWTQGELLQQLKDNLIATLENAADVWQYPAHVLFDTIERVADREQKGDGENRNVSVPVRFYFPKHGSRGPFLASHEDRVVLKMRTKEPFPFAIGFQDEKFYQSFSWQVKVSN